MRHFRILLLLLVFGGCLPALPPAFGQDAAPKPTPEQINKLIEDLKAPDSAVRQSAALALMDMDDAAAPAAPALVESLKDKDTRVRLYAANALGTIGSAAAPLAPKIVTLLRDADSGVRTAAAYALGHLSASNSFTPKSRRAFASSAAPELGKLLKDQVSEVRAAAAESLGYFGPAAAPAAPALA